MSIRIMSRVWQTPCESHVEKLVLLALADNASDEGFCWPSIATLCRKTDLAERTLQEHLRVLENRGWIATTQRLGHSSTYQLKMPTPAPAAPPQVAHPTPAPAAPPPPRAAHPEPSVDPSKETSKHSSFQKPSIEEVKLAMAKAGLPSSEVGAFFDHYESNGWRVGRTKMVSWQHAVGNWARRKREFGGNRFGGAVVEPSGETQAQRDKRILLECIR